MSAHLLSLTGAVVRLAPSRREIRKAERRKLLLAMVALAALAALCAAKMGDGRWEMGDGRWVKPGRKGVHDERA